MDTKIRFRKLGEAKQYLSTETLKLGEQSKDYAKGVMNGESGVYYYVPVDHQSVIQSEAYGPSTAKWYARGKFSVLTVNAISATGKQHAIVLRGQINDAHALNRGAPVTESSRVRFTYHPEDNPEVPKGNYQVRFAAYAQGWHAKRLIESFQVVGEVRVR